MGQNTDIDIDVADREHALAGLSHIPASMLRGEERIRHVNGVYFQNIPVDPVDGFAVYDHREAGRYGYLKIDFLNNHLYDDVRDEAHLDALIAQEPDWTLLEDATIVSGLFQIGNWFHLVAAIKPRSITDLSVVVALIRPDKRELVGLPRSEIDACIWKPNGAGYAFKRSHALAYALAIVMQLNLLCEKAAA